MSHADTVIAIGFGVGKSTIEGWLASHPSVVDAIAAARARVVLVEVMDLEAIADWNAHVSSTLAAAAAELHSIERPLFLARVGLRSLLDAGVSAFGDDWKPRIPPRAPRGAFVGYFAIGEGGAIYVAPDGDLHADPAGVAMRALATA